LVVNQGTGDGDYAAGTVVNIVADAPQAGFVFDQWTGDVADIADINNATTTLTMPAANATIMATYRAEGVDTTPPTSPTGLTAVEIGTDFIRFTWNRAQDNVGVARYWFFINGDNPITVYDTTTTITGLQPATTYEFQVSALDAAGNISLEIPGINVTTASLNTSSQVIFPNPIQTNGAFRIKRANNQKKVYVTLQTMSGKVVLQQQVQKPEEVISTQNIKPGTYLVTLQEDNKVKKMKLIIK